MRAHFPGDKGKNTSPTLDLLMGEKLTCCELVEKGNEYARKGNYRDAVKCCEKAIEMDPRSADAWLCKCNGLKGLGQHEEALDCYNKALKIDPKIVQAWVNKGNLLFKMGRPDEALDALAKAKKIK